MFVFYTFWKKRKNRWASVKIIDIPRPATVTVDRDHYLNRLSVRPFVTAIHNQAIITASRDSGLAESILNDSCLVIVVEGRLRGSSRKFADFLVEFCHALTKWTSHSTSIFVLQEEPERLMLMRDPYWQASTRKEILATPCEVIIFFSL